MVSFVKDICTGHRKSDEKACINEETHFEDTVDSEKNLGNLGKDLTHYIDRTIEDTD
jgi:hypothetical protein